MGRNGGRLLAMVALVATSALAVACGSSGSSPGVAAPPDAAADSGAVACAPDAPGAASPARQSDPKNCGACGHDCFGGECRAGVCQHVAVAPDLEGALTVACTDDEIVVANGIGGDGGILRRARVGSAPVAIVTGRDAPQWPRITKNHVYWLENGALKRTPRDQPGAVEEVVPRPVPQGDARVVTATKTVELGDYLYFATTVTERDVASSQLWKVPLAGGAPVSFGPSDFVVGSDDSLVASSTALFSLSSQGIWKVPLADPDASVLVSSGRSMAVTETDLYVSTTAFVDSSGEIGLKSTYRVLRVPLAGGAPSKFHEGEPPAERLLSDSRRLYFSNFSYDRVLRYRDHTGGPTRELATLPSPSRNGVTSIEQSANSICAVVAASSAAGQGTVYRITKPR